MIDIFNIIAWFWAMGIQREALDIWLPDLNTEEILNSFAEADTFLFQRFATIPLPHCIDVRVRLPLVHYLQSNSEEDAILSYQVYFYYCHRFSSFNNIEIVFLQFFAYVGI